MAELPSLEETIKAGVEKALKEPIVDGKSVTEWAAIGMKAPCWISVKDRLPENKKNVLVCLYDGRRKKVSNYPDGKRITIRIDRIVSDYGEPFWAKGNTPNVIAWMPLPEPPKEES